MTVWNNKEKRMKAVGTKAVEKRYRGLSEVIDSEKIEEEKIQIMCTRHYSSQM